MFLLKYGYFTSFCKTSNTINLLSRSNKLYCKTSIYICRNFLTTSKTTFLLNTSVPSLICHFVAFVIFCKSTHSQSRQFWFCNCMCLDTMLRLLSSHSTKKRGKIKHLLFKLIYLYHIYQETVLAS